ncbi:alpha/beta fold hydrolase [Aureispira anguillae]|uniref:Alpha/beta hydrolase n=1 Tax=Aureispira anguillae TaxID=2864201 RepID=A0A915YFE0_9BACT|nr:alpha/beta hydrolase [Aureispira anguillae]BDS12119.1 alpha/beta hydrolase [Aureispira anguillae]
MSSFRSQTIQLKDHRILAYCEYGATEGTPIFYAHGGPGSRLEGLFFHKEAQKQGFRLICMDRPGMGCSTFQKNRTLLDYPKDVIALADHLQIDQFGVLGFSGGGAHATVCAYAIPHRLLFNISCAGYTNFAELPQAADLLHSKADRLAVRLAQKKSPFFIFFFYLLYLSIRYFPTYFFSTFQKSISPVDQKAVTNPSIQKQFLENQKEAMRQKAKGVALDAAIHYQDWGFRLEEISMEVIIFHGSEDRLVPLEYAKHLKQNIPNATLHILENQGHLFPLQLQALIFETARKKIKQPPK